MRIGRGSGPRKCVRCLRSKSAAIAEHIRSMTPCETPGCPFAKDIIDAINAERIKPKFSFGSKTKSVNFSFGQKKEGRKISFGPKSK